MIKYTVFEKANANPAASYITIWLLDKEYLSPPQPLSFQNASARIQNAMYGGNEKKVQNKMYPSFDLYSLRFLGAK